MDGRADDPRYYQRRIFCPGLLQIRPFAYRHCAVCFQSVFFTLVGNYRIETCDRRSPAGMGGFCSVYDCSLVMRSCLAGHFRLGKFQRLDRFWNKNTTHRFGNMWNCLDTFQSEIHIQCRCFLAETFITFPASGPVFKNFLQRDFCKLGVLSIHDFLQPGGH